MLTALQATEVAQRLALFQSDLTCLDSDKIVLKHISSGKSVVLPEDLELDLKMKVSNFFSISYHDIFLVGSAKTGFSIAPLKRFNSFGDASDIDIAIVSPVLFNRVWEAAYAYQNSCADWVDKNSFFRYLSRGWIRPDMLPSAANFAMSRDWWRFFNHLSRSNPLQIRVRGGLYSSYFFLHAYQKSNIDLCKEQPT